MIRVFITILISTIFIFGENAYEKNCLPCHNNHFPISLQRMFMLYLKTYSGEMTLKGALKEYLKNPKKETSVMSDLFIDRFGIKEKTTLSDKELDEAIDIYWKLYNVRNKLR